MKKRLYVETSVWNQLYQDDRPDLKEITEKFIAVSKTGMYTIYISDYVLFEIDKCYEKKRKLILEQIEFVRPTVLTPDEECENLIQKYFDIGIITPTKANKFYDAAHVAIASVNDIEFLLTFNYRHMLKIKKMEGFNGVNILNGYNDIKLTSPEIFIPEENDEE